MDGRRHVVIGTAGHIDHGKSALIKSLTGTDPDRLKEEKERGMTTDLGFAFLREDVTIIDVPGHERFVRHMLAGASTIDLVLLVIAADDGVMPQTIEHLEILKLLGVSKGIIVVTKIDLVDAEHLEQSIAGIRELVRGTFLENAPVLRVSNADGRGIAELQQLLEQEIAATQAKSDRGIFRMPIDRCFMMKGFGTVIAGTVLSGSLKVGDTVELLPQQKKFKVRGIEVHNQSVASVDTGFRAAINLAGVEREDVARGNVIAQPGYLAPAEFVNANLFVLASARQPLKTFSRVRVHVGTSELLGRVVILEGKAIEPGGKGMVQFRLETPAACDVGDRYVIRTYAPSVTIGGGVVIEPRAAKAKGYDEDLISHLQKIESRDPAVMVEEALDQSVDLPRRCDEIAHDVNLPVATVREIIAELVRGQRVVVVDDKKGFYHSARNHQALKEKILSLLTRYHAANPTRTGMARSELASAISRGLDHTLLAQALSMLAQSGQLRIGDDGRISRADHRVVLDRTLQDVVDRMESLYRNAGFQPPQENSLPNFKLGSAELVKKGYRYLVDTGVLVFLGEGLAMHREVVELARAKLAGFFGKHQEMRVSEFRDLIGASRKFALPLLIYFDTKNITIKRGDVRILSRTGS